MLEPHELQEVTKEKLLDELEITNRVSEELEAYMKVLKDELLARMKNDGEVVGKFLLSKVKRAVFSKVSIETAKALGAVKEAIDTMVLGKLYKQGVKIDGLEVIEYLKVGEVKKEEKS